MQVEEFLARVEAASESEDFEELERLGDEFRQGGTHDKPFQPDIHLKGQDPDSVEEGDVAMAAANAWARSYRLAKFRKRLRYGYTGPVIVSEGDSWFQYPWLLKDVIDNLMEPFAINSLGAAGDTLENMLAMGEYRTAIAEQNAPIFLFSASGNDVLGGGDLSKLLHRFEPGMELADVIRDDAVEATLTKIDEGYSRIIREAMQARPGIQVFFHGYDRPLPRKDGKWLGKPMGGLKIPSGMQVLIAGHLIDRLNARLDAVARRFAGAHHVDCRGRVGASLNSWYDELHPRNPGYGRVAALFEAQIREAERLGRVVGGFEVADSPILAAAEAPAAFTRAIIAADEEDEPITLIDLALESMETASAEEAIVSPDATAILGPERGAHLTATDLQILDDYEELQRESELPDKERRLRARRHMVPSDDAAAFERILGESNLFPVNYLSRGAKKAQAVGKIQLFMQGNIPIGSGSGFLVAPGLMLTNNHVIATREVARRAKAIFDYQDDDAFQPMPTRVFDVTGDIFFTCDRNKLDFTFVSVRQDNANGDQLDDFGQFTLVEPSGKAVKGEAVSIIQHPRGDRKSIALRDSKIVGVKGDYIYYSTDTEPGSSGAPVLNDQWLPVALHHRSVPHPTIEGKWIANRGIRISQIFRHLREAAQMGDMDAVQILRLLDADSEEVPVSPVINEAPLRPREDKFIPSMDTSGPDSPIGASEAAFPQDRWDAVPGYDPDFLSETFSLPLPEGSANVRDVNGRPDLPYLHFSVVMHDARRLPMLTACNVDGTRIKRLRRTGSWRLDPRLPDDAQFGNDIYRHNDYDRGHLVRRVAPMWGTEDEARFAMADTFHYTVCAPQHARLNQGIWLELEDYLLDWAEQNRARLSIFTGPVFRADDPVYRGLVKVPADYWKVAVAQGPAGLRAVGYLHTQKNLIPTVDEAFGDYRTHRVPIHILAELSGLKMDALQQIDVAGGGFEATSTPRLVQGPEDIGL